MDWLVYQVIHCQCVVASVMYEHMMDVVARSTTVLTNYFCAVHIHSSSLQLSFLFINVLHCIYI